MHIHTRGDLGLTRRSSYLDARVGVSGLVGVGLAVVGEILPGVIVGGGMLK
jgi:hypothetical protein